MKKVFLALLLSFVLFGCTDNGVTEGEKCVTIEVVYEEESINTLNEYCTDKEYLLGVLEENREDFAVTTNDSNLGTYLTGLNGFNFEELEMDYYWALYVNDEYGLLGVADQPLSDGDVFRFEATSY